MSMEQMGGVNNVLNEQMQMTADEIVGIKLDFQKKLAEEHGEDIFDFIEKHAKDFGDYVEVHKSILAKYKLDPNGALKEVEKIIYH